MLYLNGQQAVPRTGTCIIIPTMYACNKESVRRKRVSLVDQFCPALWKKKKKNGKYHFSEITISKMTDYLCEHNCRLGRAKNCFEPLISITAFFKELHIDLGEKINNSIN